MKVRLIAFSLCFVASPVFRLVTNFRAPSLCWSRTLLILQPMDRWGVARLWL
jgi:hypothetical protein